MGRSLTSTVRAYNSALGSLETRVLVQARRFEHLGVTADDICYATQNRQHAVKQMAPQCDLVIVVGSKNSSNTGRLVEVALESGAKASYRVDNAGEIEETWLDGVSTIGVTSGASVPEALVQGVIDLLISKGWPPAEEETLIEESLSFALPPQLRKRRTTAK